MYSFKQYLDEKLILYSNGAQYGQIVILAGGAGSGKGFAAQNFMEKEKYKVRDVDEWKKTFQKIAKLKNKYPEIKDLDMSNPDHVGQMHNFVDKKGVKDKTLMLMLSSIKNKSVLPNIMFDVTTKDFKSLSGLLPDLLKIGYNPANIHLTWVLTNYEVAIQNNKDPSRGRVVPDNIMLMTHKGAANTVFKIAHNTGKKLQINGAINVILNNREHTIRWDDTGLDRTSDISGKSNEFPIKDFKYITIKERGKPRKSDKKIQQDLYNWVVTNAPKGIDIEFDT